MCIELPDVKSTPLKVYGEKKLRILIICPGLKVQHCLSNIKSHRSLNFRQTTLKIMARLFFAC